MFSLARRKVGCLPGLTYGGRGTHRTIVIDEHFATTVKQVQEEAYGKAKATILKAVEEGERMKKRRQSDLLAAMAAAEE